jgi:putative transposase
LPGKRRFIRRDGIRLFNLRYWANVLSPVAGRSAKPALIKYDPRNLSRVFWRDEQGQYWPIPYLDLKLPPISLGEHRQAIRELRAQGRRTINEKMIFEAVFARREILQRAHKRTVSQRKEQARQRQSPCPTQDARVRPTGTPEEGVQSRLGIRADRLLQAGAV